MIIFDVKENKQIDEFPTGELGQISYSRLVELLKKEQEVFSNEQITHLRFTSDQLQYRVEKKTNFVFVSGQISDDRVWLQLVQSVKDGVPHTATTWTYDKREAQQFSYSEANSLRLHVGAISGPRVTDIKVEEK